LERKKHGKNERKTNDGDEVDVVGVKFFVTPPHASCLSKHCVRLKKRMHWKIDMIVGCQKMREHWNIGVNWKLSVKNDDGVPE